MQSAMFDIYKTPSKTVTFSCQFRIIWLSELYQTECGGDFVIVCLFGEIYLRTTKIIVIIVYWEYLNEWFYSLKITNYILRNKQETMAMD